MLTTCLFLCIFICIGSEAGLAPFIKPCVWNDQKCIMESSEIALPHIVKGIPELGVLPLDPITIKHINADNGDLKLHFDDLKIVGIGKSQFINVERPDADKTALLKFEFPAVVTGKYKIGGKLFVLDISGEGETEITCDKIRVDVDIKIKKFEKNGKKYYKISSFDYTYEPIEKVFYKFTNLYNGDEEKAKLVLDLMNQNWKELLIGIGKPVIEEIVVQEISRIKKFIQAIPIDELEIEQ